jgi:hypothetical protein
MGYMKEIDRRIRQGGDDAIAAVGELLPRWISVAEQLPDTPSGEWEIHGVCVLAWSKSNGHDTAWFERDQEYGNRWSWECVSDPTHWMKLPEPPEVT